MRRVFGPRFAAEAAAIVGVAVLVWYERLSRLEIVAAMAGIWLAIALLEWWIGRRAVPVEDEWREAEPEPELAPEPGPEPQLELAYAGFDAELEPAPAEEPEPEPEPRLEHAYDGFDAELEPAEAPEPEPEPESEPEPVGATVAVLPTWQIAPREWNVWDLERLLRERAGADTTRDEERSFLLLYLREFAGPDGLLPADFDGLVRDSFGDLIAGGRR